MTLVSELELPAFDYTDVAMRGERFHTAIGELSAQGWLATGPFGYVVLDRAAGEFFLRTRSAEFPGMKIAEIFDVREGPLYDEMRHNILHVNGHDHTRLRRLINPALSARAVERYRPAMRRFLEELWATEVGPLTGGSPTVEGDDGVAERTCEFVEAFAKPYPSRVIAQVMGAPLEDAPRLHHWSNWIQRQFDAVSMVERREEIERAAGEFYEYAFELVRRRREDPGEDLVSALIAASDPETNGEAVAAGNGAATRNHDRARLSDVECVNLVFNVLAGGVDTTQSQLAHAIRLLAEHPDQWAMLADDPELSDRAVEEALRFEPITPFTARIALEDISFRDVTFPEGTIVMVCAFTGNRDLEDGQGQGADEAERFDITADRGKARPLTFGAGVHYCLGANLARLELSEALAFLAPRMKNLRLDGAPVYEGITGIYGLAELPLRFSV
jgi:cytochrome P450